MIRNLKALGLALVAVFAMSAVVASAASAQTNGQLTSDGDFYLLGTETEEGNKLSYPGLNDVTCTESHFTGEEIGGGPLSSGAETITVTPTYTQPCRAGGLFVTVDMNTCHYVFHIGETTEVNEDEYYVTSDLVCTEEGDEAVVHVYLNESHTIGLCTVRFGEQTGLSGGVVRDFTNNSAEVSGTFGGISAEKEGACGSGSTEEASYAVNVLLEGVDEKEEEPTHTTITH